MRSTLILTVVAGMLAGCAGLDMESMTPQLEGPQRVASSQTLRILPIDDTPFSRRSSSAIKGRMFRETLAGALRKSNLLRAVITDGDSDLTLRVVLHQQMMIFDAEQTAFETRQEVVAEYWLMNTRSQEVVWHEHIRTVAGARAFGGNERITKSMEGAVRENIHALLKAADAQWPKS